MKKGTFGVILILVGIAWLIHQTGVISINWVLSFKKLWPVFLVALGASFIAGPRKKLKLGIWVLAFALFIGFGIYKRNEPGSRIILYRNPQIDYGPVSQLKKERAKNEIALPAGTEEGKLILQLGGVNMNLSDGPDDLLVSLDSNIPNLEERLAEGKQTVLEYSHDKLGSSNSKRNFNLELNPEIIWDINANLGVIDGKLDLGKIPVRNVELNLGAGDMDLIIGGLHEDTNVVLRAGAADLNIYLPESSGLKVKAGKILSDISFHNISVTNKDGIFLSENYEEASHNIDIDVQTGLSSIKIFAK